MRTPPLATTSGVVVMVAGIAALAGMSSRHAPASESPPNSEQTQSITLPAEDPLSELAGIDPSVLKTLESHGRLESLSPEEQSELDPVIARVLAGFGATLAVPIGGGLNP